MRLSGNPRRQTLQKIHKISFRKRCSENTFENYIHTFQWPVSKISCTANERDVSANVPFAFLFGTVK